MLMKTVTCVMVLRLSSVYTVIRDINWIFEAFVEKSVMQVTINQRKEIPVTFAMIRVVNVNKDIRRPVRHVP